MTPKEKARKLVQTYCLKSNQPIECALVCVDEIINGNFGEGYNHEFWTKVKIELEKKL